MFDTMTMTKIIGGLCGTFLIFLLGNWVADSIYHFGGDGGHGEEHAMAYPIETDDGGHAEEAVEAGSDFMTLYAAADAGAGEKVFAKCRACHKLETGGKGAGPDLFAIVGRDIGSVDGYSYSGALGELAGDWTPEALDGFLENPKGYAAGTKMGFKGLPSAEDRANIIAYLNTIGS